jgi:N-acyl-D-aspartate/D-glutamate deacylase
VRRYDDILQPENKFTESFSFAISKVLDSELVSEGTLCLGYRDTWRNNCRRGTYEEPNLYPEGIKYVVINGEIVVENGQHAGRLPGKVLRRASREG